MINVFVHSEKRRYTLHWTQMADDSGGQWPFGVGLNGRKWPHQPFRPRLKCPIQSQVADSDWIGHLSLGRQPFRPAPNSHRPPGTGGPAKHLPYSLQI